MQRIKFFFQYFKSEPLWFKVIIITPLLLSIVFSSSVFSYNFLFQGFAKLFAAIFFCAYGLRLRRNKKVAIIFTVLAAFSLYLSLAGFITGS